MDKDVEIIFPFVENKDVRIINVTHIFWTLMELTVKESLEESHKFKMGEDLTFLINSKNLAEVEKSMQAGGYFYKVAYRTSSD